MIFLSSFIAFYFVFISLATYYDFCLRQHHELKKKKKKYIIRTKINFICIKSLKIDSNFIGCTQQSNYFFVLQFY
jgi:hypothetical protein